jgi:hypothetical protein
VHWNGVQHKLHVMLTTLIEVEASGALEYYELGVVGRLPL